MVRVISKLDVKPPNVVKPIQFEGLRKVGLPRDLVSKSYSGGADEIFYIDIVASLYRRKICIDSFRESISNAFVPVAYGGGIRTVSDVSLLFEAGADKIVINTKALQETPTLIDEAAKLFGSQSVVLNIEAKRTDENWLCYSDCGRINSGKTAKSWAVEAVDRGCGEILIQSVDRDGTNEGMDVELVGELVNAVQVPVIAQVERESLKIF